MTFSPLQKRLRGPIADVLRKELGVENIHALPRIEKVVVNVGINKTKMEGKEVHQYIAENLATITGQKPVFRTARMAVSNFKTRKGSVVGACVTLRGQRMYAFLDKFVHVALPRIRDFRGLRASMDGHGNFSIGLREHTIFPEVSAPDASKIFGMQVTITTTASTDEQGLALFKAIGFPFRGAKDPTDAPRS
jgi:large subunit ribosomal protein L5